VTAVCFLESQNVVVSASKDTFIKFWDLSNQHCFKTLTGHVTEVWDLVLLQADSLLISGGSDMELR
jgi:U3 small nucleolar RNA-associated protein 12